MFTFIIGLIILICGGFIMGRVCERAFGPDDRKTPAYQKTDGVDYVPMNRRKISLINLLNIAGTGPILGPIQGILFGPIAFITIPIGCIIGGAAYDYFSGMIACRNGGMQMPDLVGKYLSKRKKIIFTIFLSILLLLAGTVFVYTPGDIAATQLLGQSASSGSVVTWIIYGVIIVYYLIATVLPIDKIIGRIYPVFGAILIVSTLGLFIMLFICHCPMAELTGSWNLNGFDFYRYFTEGHFIPAFFVTVACGILSGFHATQVTMMSRTIKRERDGRSTFYNMMIVEGFIACVWAACTMSMIGLGVENSGITMEFTNGVWQYFANVGGQITAVSPTGVIGVIATNLLGQAGGIIASCSVIILSITTGDTALRSLRITFTETFHIKQESTVKRLLSAVPIFAAVIVLLILTKTSADGFGFLWRYMSWDNQAVAIFGLAMIMIWMMTNGRSRYIWLPAIPLVFYSFVASSYILNATIGFGLPWTASYVLAAVFAGLVLVFTVREGWKRRKIF